MDSDRIYNCLQMTCRFSEIMDGSAIRLRDDLREARLEFAHAFAGMANEFLFEFFAGAQMIALRSWILRRKECAFFCDRNRSKAE